MTYVEDIRQEIRAAGDVTERLLANMTALGRQADRQADIPAGLFAGLEVRKLNHAVLPLELGGLAALQSGVARCVLMEALGYADAALAVALPGPGLTLPPILSLASPAQREDLLGRFDRDEPVWGSFAITEPAGGSDAGRPATTARREGSDYVLDGEKCFIGNGARASFAIVFATADPERGQFGILPFVVPQGAPGFVVDDDEPMLGLRAVRVARLRFEECRVPAEQVLGGDGNRRGAGAFLAAQRSWEYMRPGLSALILGALGRLLDGLAAIAVGRDDAELRAFAAGLERRMRPRLASARLLSHHAAALFDAGEESALVSSMAKAMSADLARTAAAEALAAVAGSAAGLAEDAHDIERWARDAQAFELMEGTTEVHQLMIAKAWNVRSKRQAKRPAPVTKGSHGP